jgi:hypothetical protein
VFEFLVDSFNERFQAFFGDAMLFRKFFSGQATSSLLIEQAGQLMVEMLEGSRYER